MSFNIKSANVHSLDISQLTGKVTIKVHDKDEILIETTNEENVEFKRSGSYLEIRGKMDEVNSKGSKFSINNFFGSNIVINNNNNITIVNGKVISGNVIGGKIPEVEMEVFVPKNVIKFLDVSGVIKVKVENISNTLDIDNSGQTQVEISGVSTLNIDASGQSKVEAHLVSKLNADVSGQSKVDIHGTNFSKIEVDISGQSNLAILSDNIDELEADISGQSKLFVHGNIKNQSIDRSGMATFKNI